MFRYQNRLYMTIDCEVIILYKIIIIIIIAIIAIIPIIAIIAIIIIIIIILFILKRVLSCCDRQFNYMVVN